MTSQRKTENGVSRFQDKPLQQKPQPKQAEHYPQSGQLQRTQGGER